MSKIKIEDLQQLISGDIITVKITDEIRDWRIVGASSSGCDLIVESQTELEFIDESTLKDITSWKRDGKELLKKELVPVCDVKEWADKDRDIYEKDCCIRRVLRGLKVALKDESVFQNRNSNSCLEYNISEGHWIFSEWDTWDHGLPTFTDSSDDDRQAVIDYMNKMFPRGWSV